MTASKVIVAPVHDSNPRQHRPAASRHSGLPTDTAKLANRSAISRTTLYLSNSLVFTQAWWNTAIW